MQQARNRISADERPRSARTCSHARTIRSKACLALRATLSRARTPGSARDEFHDAPPRLRNLPSFLPPQDDFDRPRAFLAAERINRIGSVVSRLVKALLESGRIHNEAAQKSVGPSASPRPPLVENAASIATRWRRRRVLAGRESGRWAQPNATPRRSGRMSFGAVQRRG